MVSRQNRENYNGFTLLTAIDWQTACMDDHNEVSLINGQIKGA